VVVIAPGPKLLSRLATMSDDKRPGGLTVLAVLSFIWGGILLLSQALFCISLAMGNQPKLPEPLRSLPASILWLNSVGGLVCGALLVVAGIGYLKQRRILGRVMGSVYAILTLAILGVVETVEPRLFSFETVIGLVYALLILLLVNVTFRHDLSR
jgi:hypothetical protein